MEGEKLIAGVTVVLRVFVCLLGVCVVKESIDMGRYAEQRICRRSSEQHKSVESKMQDKDLHFNLRKVKRIDNDEVSMCKIILGEEDVFYFLQ